MSAALQGFAQGFFDKTSENMEKQRDAADSRIEAIRKSRLKKIEKDQEAYSKKSEAWGQVNHHLNNGNAAEAAVAYASMHGIYGEAKDIGMEAVWNKDKEATSKFLKAEYETFNKSKAPTAEVDLASDEIYRQAYLDQNAVSRGLRKMVGVEAGADIFRGYKGLLSEGEYDKYAQQWREAETTDERYQIAKTIEAKAAEAEAGKQGEAEPHGIESPFDLKGKEKEGGDSGVVWSPQTIHNTDGSSEVVLAGYNKKSGERYGTKPLVDKKPMDQQATMSRTEDDIIQGSTFNTMALLKQEDEDHAEKVGGLLLRKKDKKSGRLGPTPPGEAMIKGEVARLTSEDSTLDTEAAYRQAADKWVEYTKIPGALVEDPGFWNIGDPDITGVKPEIKMRGPNGQVGLIEWQDVQEAQKHGWTAIAE